MKRIRAWVTLAAAVIGLSAVVYGAGTWRDAALAQRPRLPVAFEHIDHSEAPCADCHHNFTDDTGGGACYYCHKISPEINTGMERMFHDFCRDCHVRTRLAGRDSGPLRECSACHH